MVDRIEFAAGIVMFLGLFILILVAISGLLDLRRRRKHR